MNTAGAMFLDIPSVGTTGAIVGLLWADGNWHDKVLMSVTREAFERARKDAAD